jgi:hypothetical protein
MKTYGGVEVQSQSLYPWEKSLRYELDKGLDAVE